MAGVRWNVVGARIHNGILEVRHVETGQLSLGDNDVERVKRKFSEPIQKSLERQFRRVLAYEGEAVNYEKIYVPTYSTKPVVEKLREAGILVWPFPDFLKNKVIPTINQWKSDPPHQPLTRGD